MLHIIGRSNNKVPLFNVDEDREHFKATLLKYSISSQLYIHNYTLMDTHFHSMMWAEDTRTIAPAMKALTVSYHHYYCKRYEYRGHLWHGRFRSVIISSMEQMLQCGRYIELNCVYARICVHPKDYTWSSYHYHAHGKHDPLIQQVMYPSQSIAWRPGLENKQYQEFVLAGIDLDYQMLKKQFEHEKHQLKSRIPHK